MNKDPTPVRNQFKGLDWADNLSAMCGAGHKLDPLDHLKKLRRTYRKVLIESASKHVVSPNTLARLYLVTEAIRLMRAKGAQW